MKILKVRRGFSTNCSGANEYLPPQDLAPPGADADGGAEPPPPPAKVVFRWVTMMPDGAPPPMLRAALAAGDDGLDAGAARARGDTLDEPVDLAANDANDARDAGASAAAAGARDESPRDAPPPERARGTGSFGIVLFAVMVALLAAYGIERWTRRVRRTLGKKGDDDGR
jgi:hypothetical protein